MSDSICRLCLQTICENNYQRIEESSLKTLKLNIKISEGNVICPECSNYLQVLSNIKTTYVSRKYRILPLPDIENEVDLDAVVTEIKCSFCPRPGEKDGFVSLNESRKHQTLVNMLKQHIPEINLSNTEELLTCEPCLRALQDILNFVSKCLEVEEEINKYTGLDGTDNKGQIELKDVQQFMLRPVLNVKIESFDINELGDGCCDEIKKEFSTAGENEVKCDKEISHPEFIIETAEAELKLETQIFHPELIIKTEAVDSQFGPSDCDGCRQTFIENENAVDPVEISEMERHGGNTKLPQKKGSKMRKFKCEICSYVAKQRGHLKYHLLTHGSSSQINMLKCDMCSYKTYRKSTLNQHSLTHKKLSECKLFKCEMCSYETKTKCCLKEHFLTHRSSLEINMLKCENCVYETKHRTALKNHLLVHKSPTEIKMFKCEICSFETKRKQTLKSHLLIHRSPSEIDMFKCTICSFETKRQSALKRHLLIHKTSSEVNTFKCAICPYEAKKKYHLKNHVLTHRKMFKCKSCSYKSEDKATLMRHSLTHRHICTMCEFVTKHKYLLKRHLLTHRSPTDTEVSI